MAEPDAEAPVAGLVAEGLGTVEPKPEGVGKADGPAEPVAEPGAEPVAEPVAEPMAEGPITEAPPGGPVTAGPVADGTAASWLGIFLGLGAEPTEARGSGADEGAGGPPAVRYTP